MTSKQLRQYSRFLYRHISRIDYGWSYIHNNIYSKARVTKEKLLFAKKVKSNRSLIKLSETHLKQHISGSSTYYYTGSHIKREMLLCVDIDAKNNEPDSLDAAHFINFWFLNSSGYIEPSTGGLGIHLYFRLSYPEFTSTSQLKSLVSQLSNYLTTIVKYEGYEAQVDMVAGLPSDYKNDTLAQVIKLPRPSSEEDLKLLLNLQVISLLEMAENIKTCLNEHDAFKVAVVPTVNPSSLSYSSPIMMLADPETKKRKRLPEISEIKQRKPLYRALWTVQSLAQVLGRMPTLEEALRDYERLSLNTGEVRDNRISRFKSVITYVGKTFDPNKRRSYSRLFPMLKEEVKMSLKGVSLRYNHNKETLSVDDLTVGYYAVMANKNVDGGFPIVGLVALYEKLKSEGVLKGSINNQKSSQIRKILCDIGLVELIPTDNGFKNHKAQCYKLKRNV